MDEDKYNDFKILFNIDEINNIIDLYKKEKDKNNKKRILELNKEILSKFLNCIVDKKLEFPENFVLNYDYETLKENINRKKKFALLKGTFFPEISDKEKIFYLIHKEKHYIYLRSKKIFFEVKKENSKNNTLCNLDIYKINDTIIISEYLDSLKKIMESNKFNKKSKLINEYYLINNKWIISGERNIKQEDIYYVKEKFKPSYITDFKELEYPKNFCFLEKEGKNELMMESLINFFAINPEDVDVRKIAIISDYLKFICIMIKSAAFFYLENKKIKIIKKIIKMNQIIKKKKNLV